MFEEALGALPLLKQSQRPKKSGVSSNRSQADYQREVEATTGGPLSGTTLSKNRSSRPGIGWRRRMSAMEKAMVFALVKASKMSKNQTLAEIGIIRKTHCDWVRR